MCIQVPDDFNIIVHMNSYFPDQATALSQIKDHYCNLDRIRALHSDERLVGKNICEKIIEIGYTVCRLHVQFSNFRFTYNMW